MIIREINIQSGPAVTVGVNGVSNGEKILDNVGVGINEFYLVLNAGDELIGYSANAPTLTISGDVETVGE